MEYLPLAHRAPEADTLCSVSSPGSMVLWEQDLDAGRRREAKQGQQAKAREKTNVRMVKKRNTVQGHELSPKTRHRRRLV